jgi:hypothetical protein
MKKKKFSRKAVIEFYSLIKQLPIREIRRRAQGMQWDRDVRKMVLSPLPYKPWEFSFTKMCSYLHLLNRYQSGIDLALDEKAKV